VGACGSVSDNPKQDAATSDTGQQIDMAVTPDTAPVVATAIDATNITTFSAVTAAYTKIPYSSVAYDDRSEFANNTFTAQTGGDYSICASIYLAYATFLTIDVFKNGTRERGLANGTDIASGCSIVRLSAGDAVDIRVYQNSGADRTVDPQANWQWLTITSAASTAHVKATQQLVLANVTYQKVAYTNEIYDDAMLFNSTTSRFTAAQAGDYQVCASYYLNHAVIPTQMDVYLNDARNSTLSFGVGGVGGCRTLRLTTTDAIDVYLHQFSGSQQTMNAEQFWDWVVIGQQSATVSVAGIANFSLPATTFTKVPYVTERFDDSGQFDVGTSTFTAATGGDYRVCASMLTATTADGDELHIYKNGVIEKGLDYGHHGVAGCRVLRLAAADQIQIFAWSPSTVNLTSDSAWDWFEVSKLR